jgi:quercetin dioxygenase-like cupin family protein
MTEAAAGLRRLEWHAADPPSVAGVTERLRDEGVEPYAWSSAAGDEYPVHQHGYTKLLMCAAGSITFLVGMKGERVELRAGDGFVLPGGTTHSAVVGPAGCTCLEGHQP